MIDNRSDGRGFLADSSGNADSSGAAENLTYAEKLRNADTLTNLVHASIYKFSLLDLGK